MISICGRDNSLCKKMGTSLSPPPPAPALLPPGLAASSTELFIGRGAMMMMMIEKSNEILLERELYRVGNDRRSNDLRRSNDTQRNIMIWCYHTSSAKYILRASEELTQIAARTVDHVHIGIVQTHETNGPKNDIIAKNLVIESLKKTPLECRESVCSDSTRNTKYDRPSSPSPVKGLGVLSLSVEHSLTIPTPRVSVRRTLSHDVVMEKIQIQNPCPIDPIHSIIILILSSPIYS